VAGYARGKLVAKHLDLIVANRVGVADGGFESDQNAMTAYWQEGERVFTPGAKTRLADELIDLIVERLDA
ncbi:MAG: phosphopantothenoylcysteine decarboxylase, partial [Pseudoxanthomonas sp.]